MFTFMATIKYPVWGFIVISPLVKYLDCFPFFIITNPMCWNRKAAPLSPSVSSALGYFSGARYQRRNHCLKVMKYLYAL